MTHTLSTRTLRVPHFPGIVGYTPLPCPMSQEEIAKLPYKVLVDEIRHYLTIVEQKQQWAEKKSKLIVVESDHQKMGHRKKKRS